MTPRFFHGRRPNGYARLNHASPLSRGLVAWVPTGTLYLREALSNTFGMDQTLRVNPVPSTLGGLVYPGSASSNARMPVTPGLASWADFTIAAWVNVNAYQASSPNISGIVSFYTTEAPGIVFRFGDASVNKATLDVAIGNAGSLAGSAVNPTATWLHVGLTRAGAVGTFYIGGLVDASGTLPTNTFSLSGQTYWLLANDFDGARPLNGLIGDVTMHNRALSAAEMWALGGDPRTRWSLYWQPSSRVFYDFIAPPAGAVSMHRPQPLRPRVFAPGRAR